MTLVIILGSVLLISLLRLAHVQYSVSNFKKAWVVGNQKPIDKDSIVIAAFGDSTVQGVGALSRSGSFVSQIATRVSEQTGKPVQIYNFSVSGAESKDISRQVTELKKLSRVDIVIVAVGPNDITHYVTMQQFLINYEALLLQLPKEKTVIASIPAMRPKDGSGKSADDWNKQLIPLAQKLGVAVAHVYEKISPRINDPTIYGGDFYHPSKIGYKLWADAFEPPVLEILRE